MNMELLTEDEVAQRVKLDHHTEDKLGWLLNDDERQMKYVRAILGSLAVYGDNIRPRKSRTERDKHLKAADLASQLADLFPGFEDFNNRLKRAIRFHQKMAELRDPKGKAVARNSKQIFIAESLIDGIENGKLILEPRTNPQSDLARLFRLLCKAAGLNPPSNAAHYLGLGVEQLNKNRRSLEKQKRISVLIEQALSGEYQGDDLVGDIKAIQNGE